jgi:predicted small lipoprotein YifL
MRHWLVRLPAIAVFVVLAGCGGGGGTTVPTAAAPTEAQAAESSGPSDGGTGTGGQPSVEASVAAPASQAPAGGGGGTAAGVCELVTADELAGIFGVPSVKLTVVPGPPDTCIVQSDSGDPLTAWSLTTAQASIVYDALTADPATILVSGIGDKAAIVQNTGLLVLKGGSLLVISVSGGADMSEEEGIDASKKVGALAAGRL